GKELDVFTYTCAGDTLLGFGRSRGREAPGPVVLGWDLSNGKLVKTTRIEVRESGFAVTPDGKLLVTNGGLRVWNTQTGAEAVKLEEPTRVGYNMRFSQDGKHVVGVVNDPADEKTGTATVWELDRGRVVGRMKLPRRYDNVFLLTDNRTLLATGRGLMLSTW